MRRLARRGWLLAAVAVLAIGGARADEAGTWTAKAPMPTARARLAVAGVSGLLYAIGGSTSSAAFPQGAKVEAFDPATNAWTTKAELYPPRGELAAATLNGQIYVVGGISLNFPGVPPSGRLVEAYDPVTNSWETRASLPGPRASAAAGVVDGILYVVGGTDGDLGNAPSSSLFAYDPVSDTWTTKAPMPTARYALAVGVVGCELYAVGGAEGSNKATVEAYDPSSDTWRTCAPMSVARSYLGVAALGGRLYAVGGQGGIDGSAGTLVEAYDPATNVWTLQPPMPTSRDSLGVAALDGVLYAAGGEKTSGGYVATVEAFTPPASPEGSWSQRAPMPTTRTGGGIAAVNGRLYVVGGATSYPSCAYSGITESYDDATDSWTTHAPMPTGRESFSLAASDGRLYAFGGSVGCGIWTRAAEVYDPATNKWGVVASPAEAHRGGSAVSLGGLIYLMGGDRGGGQSTLLEAYDPATDSWAAKAPMRAAKHAFGAAALNGLIYVVGGYEGGRPVDAVEVYDPAADTWTAGAPMPSARGELGLVALGHRLYAIGGNGPVVPFLATVESYDPATRTWSAVAPMPRGRSSLMTAALDGRIHAAGGFRDQPGSKVLAEHAVYTPAAPRVTSVAIAPTNPSILLGRTQQFVATGTFNDGSTRPLAAGTDTWASLPPMPTPRRGAVAAYVGGKVYVIGGEGSFATCEAYDAATNAWSTVAPLTRGRGYAAVGVIAGRIYVAGGTDWAGARDMLEVYDPAADRWETRAPLPAGRWMCSGGVHDGKLYVIGGFDGALEPVATVERYDPATDSWTAMAPMPAPRGQLPSVAGRIGSKLYVAGGVDRFHLVATCEAYDASTDTWSAVAPMPAQRKGAGAEVMDGVLYVVSGDEGVIYHDEAFAFDPATNAWTTRAPIPTPRYYPAVAAGGGRLFFAGGRADDTRHDVVEAYTAQGEVDWTSSVPTVATIDGFGLATARGAGTTSITARAADGVCSSTTLTVIEDTKAPVVTIDTSAWPTGGLVIGPGVPREAAVMARIDEMVSGTTVTSSPAGAPAKFEFQPGGGIATFVVALGEGENPITVTATDTAGNTGTDTVTVILDTMPPVIAHPSGMTLEATGALGAVADFEVSSTDDRDGPVEVSCDPASGSTFGLGETTVHCAATDRLGNTATAHFTVTIRDTTSPLITVPADITAEASGPAGASVTFAASADDIVDGSVAVTSSPASGSTFPLGTTTVDCSAVDAAGNPASASFTVTVVDTTPPVLGGIPADITVITASGSGAVVTFAAPTATDLVDGTFAATCVPASGSTFVIGTSTVDCSATDAAGNRASASFSVTVQTLAQATGALLSQLAAGSLPAGVENDLGASLNAAQASFDRGNDTAGSNQLRAFVNKVNAQSGKAIDTATAAALIAAAEQILAAASG